MKKRFSETTKKIEWKGRKFYLIRKFLTAESKCAGSENTQAGTQYVLTGSQNNPIFP